MKPVNSSDLRGAFTRGLIHYYCSGSREDVEDAIEYAIESLIMKSKDFITEEERQSWLFGTARNYLRHSARDARRWRGLEAVEQFGCEDDAIMAFEANDDIEAMLAVLIKKDSELLHEKYIGGRSISKIAANDGVNASSLRTRHQRAIQTIRKYFPNR